MAYTGETTNPQVTAVQSYDEDAGFNADLSVAHEAKTQAAQSQIEDAEFAKLLNQSQENEATPAQAAAQPDNAPVSSKSGGAAAEEEGSVLSDIGRGIIEAPLQAVGGAIDAVNNTIKATQDVADWLNENVVDLGGIGWDEDGIKFTSGESLKDVDQPELPTTDKAESTTGGVVRSISQFLIGFATAGKYMGAVGKAGVKGAMAKGAAADFAAFDPSQDRLSNLVQDVPALKNPITDYLSNKDDDSAMEGRVKNTLEGLGVGVAADGLIKGIRGIKNINLAKEKSAVELDRAPQTEFDMKVEQADVESAINGKDTPEFEAAAPKQTVDGMDADPSPTQPPSMVGQKDGKTYVNWSRIDTPDDVKRTIQDMADKLKPEVDEARRGVQTFEQTKLNAESINAWDVLQSRRQGEPLNAEQSVAVRELWATSGDNLTRIAKEANQNPSQENMFALRKMMAVHKEVQNQVIAARTETARALASWRIPAGSTRSSDLKELFDTMGGTEVNQMIAHRIATLSENGMVKELDEFVNKTAIAKTRDAVAQAWINGLLSSPHTHVRNFISQTATIGQQMYERKAANLMGQAFGYDSSVPSGEIGHMLTGLASGIRDAFVMSSKDRSIAYSATKKAFSDLPTAKDMVRESGMGTVWKTAFTGESGFGIGKTELPREGALSAEAWNQANDTVLGKALNFIDTVTQLPGKALEVSDELFKTASYRMELQARAARMASDEVNSGMIKPEDLKNRMAEIIENPPEDVKGSLQDFARHLTFQDVPEDTGVWKAWKGVSRFPVLGKIVMPFSRTPYNIARYSFERTPLAPFVKRWRDDIEAGGARREMAVTKMATGSSILLAAADLAMSGNITGPGPDNSGQRQLQRRMGIQPNSIKHDDGQGNVRYFAYTGMDPISTPLGLASGIVDILSNSDIDDDDIDVEKAIIAASMSIANQVTSQQYMSGVSSMFNMMSDPQRYGQTWWNRLAGSVVPSGVAFMNRVDDPYAKSAFDMIDAIKARTPGLSKDLPNRRDLWGRSIDYRSGLGSLYDFISPLYSEKENAEPIDKELNRLELYIPSAPKTMSFDGVSIDMRKYPHAYSDFVELAGNKLTKDEYGIPIDPLSNKGLMGALNSIVTGENPLSIEYNLRTDGPDGGKATMIQSFVQKYRDAAKKRILEDYPEIRAEYNTKKSKQKAKFNLMGQ